MANHMRFCQSMTVCEGVHTYVRNNIFRSGLTMPPKMEPNKFIELADEEHGEDNPFEEQEHKVNHFKISIS